jgi:Na+-translocating ferredoxin:NAD+ oxidoreductase RnfD subunit
MGGRSYRVIAPSLRDPRLHVAAVLLSLQVLGQTVLDFRLSIAQILICLALGGAIEFTVALFKDRTIMWPASGLLTGNSTAFILRTPGTLHGQWWSLNGIWIFVGVVAISMASKYLIRWRGQHIFNPSNLGLVVAFVALGPQYTEPQDLWWIQLGPWMLLTYAILIVGGLLIALELRLLGLELGFLAAFAGFAGLALWLVPDHCMVASWHVTPMCGGTLWQILVTSPELLVFALFMLPDPRTVPEGQAARFVFGVLVALLAVLLIGPSALEFWTKTAILGSLVIACALRFAIGALVAPLDEGRGLRGLGFRLPAMLPVALLGVWLLPLAADLSTHGPEPAAGLADRTRPVLTASVGSGPGLAAWLTENAATALPPAPSATPQQASATVFLVPAIPKVSVDSNVGSFDPTVSQQSAAQMARAAVLDLVIESEARRAHDLRLAQQGASGDGLQEFTDVINQDIGSGQIVLKTYSFDQVTIQLFLPKYSTQSPRLVGVTLHGTATLTTLDGAGHVLSQNSANYQKSWGLGPGNGPGSHQVIVQDYSDLSLA